MNRVFSSAVVCLRAWIRRNGIFTAGLIIPLAIVYGPALKAHVQRSLNPFVFNDDARTLIFTSEGCFPTIISPHTFALVCRWATALCTESEPASGTRPRSARFYHTSFSS